MTRASDRVMVVTAHPDAPEFGAGGTVAKLVKEGCEVTYDCVYPLVRDHLSFPELLQEYEPHKVREVYLIQWEQPALLVDITETMELKLEAVTCHASQVGDFKAVEARLRQRFAALATGKGYAYAEGFDQVVLPG
jgi:LmbE family N-acetylglucosaminyl deacetylase